MLEKKMYDCEIAPVEDLDEWVQSVYMDHIPGNFLRGYIVRESPKNIDWKRLRYIRVLGDDDKSYLENFECVDISRGFYLNADGTWLLLILPEKPHMGEYFSRCSRNVESLWILNSQMYSRDMGKLPGLRKLLLRDNRLLDTIERLDRLTELEELTITNCSRLTELPGLGKLTKLASLCIYGCSSLTALPGLDKLTRLTALFLYECDSLTALPGLEKLTSLTSLNLSDCSKLTSLPGVEKLIGLTYLNLFGCSGLTALPGLENLTGLTSLDLSHCRGLAAIPDGIRRMQALRLLNLRSMELAELPDWLPEITERFTLNWNYRSGEKKAVVSLEDTTVEGVDMSIFEQPHEMVVKWFEERKKGDIQQLNEIKVVFLGDGEAGKSHTIARLMNDGGDPVGYMDKSTPGIVIKHQKYERNGRKFRVHYWDFGGQEIMHSMHRIFLTNRTMYVVLLNARDDTQGDRARYWLQNIQSFAPDAPVMLVLNKIDMNPKASVDERDLRNRFPNLTQVVRLSALTFDKRQFNSVFSDVLLDEIQKTGYLDVEWPAAWKKVKRALENLESYYILGREYKKICRECQVDDVQAELLRWFNDLGVSFCFCDKEDYTLKKHVILRPDWITNGLYIILFNDCPGAKNGLIPHEDIYDLLERAACDESIHCTLPSAKYDQPGDVEYVLGVMRKFQLSLNMGNDTEFIPMLCQQDSTVDIQYYEKDADTLEFRMEFDYLPNNLLHRLMVERHAELDMHNVWRTGALFRLPGTDISAVVVIDGETLKFFIRHDSAMFLPNTYLTMLKANVDRIVQRMGIQEPENVLVYKLDGKTGTFDYEELKQAWQYGETTVFSKIWKRRIPIADILNQSAPESLDNERKLLQSVQKACEQIQREPECRGSKEDNRNRRMRDALENRGYQVYDQRQMGASGTRKDVGELDLMLYREERDEKKPWSIIEALRVDDGAKRDWNSHLGKLLDNYNPHGVPFLFLVTYADCEKEQFERIWKGYREHIQKHSAGKFGYESESFRILNNEQDGYYIQTAVSRYRCGGYTPTVYHIFVQMDPKQKEAKE